MAIEAFGSPLGPPLPPPRNPKKHEGRIEEVAATLLIYTTTLWQDSYIYKESDDNDVWGVGMSIPLMMMEGEEQAGD